jgi:multiple sugar transport system ATP-binding protein
MLAGLEEVSVGRIWIDARDVTELAPRDRDGVPELRLYPHMTVRQNLGCGLKIRRAPKPPWRTREAINMGGRPRCRTPARRA